MSDLLDFQRAFAASIDRPAAGAMAVYRNTVLHGAAEALRANYPVVEQILGTDMFGAVAVDYAVRRPPRSPVLALYGARFADWLEEQPWIADMPYLPDVARVERLRVEALMAPDAPSPAGARPGALPFRLHPATRFDWLTAPGLTVWSAHQQPLAGELELDWRAEGVLVTRATPFALRVLPLDRDGHRLLFGMRLGESAADSLAAAARLYPESDPQQMFASLLIAGAFAVPSQKDLK